MHEKSVVRTVSEQWMDFRTIDKLSMISGVNERDLVKLAVKELVDNALDECGSCLLSKTENGFYVEDNGGGIPGTDEDLAYYFSVRRPSSSTKGVRLPTRGALGNGLRFVAGVALAHEGTSIIVSTQGRTLELKPQYKNGETTYTKIDRFKGNGTRIEMTFSKRVIEKLLGDYTKWGDMAISMARGEYYKGKSSPKWYDSSSFYEMLQTIEYSDNSIKRIIKEIFGKYPQKELSQAAIQLLRRRATSLSLEESNILLRSLRQIVKYKANKIKPHSLGCVGKLNDYQYYDKYLGYYNPNNTASAIKAELPFVLEMWAKHSDNPRVEFCVNRSPVPENIMCSFWNKTIHIYGCKLWIEDIKAESAMAYRFNLITPFVPKESASKKPQLNFFNDTCKKLLLKACRKLAADLRKSRNKSNFTVNKPNNTMPEEVKDIMEKSSYYSIKQMAEKMNCKTKELLVMAEKNDPFYAGRETCIYKAFWFMKWWKIFDYQGGVHIRRMFYQIVSQTKPTKHDGGPFINTDKCWNYLCEASKYARELGMIDPGKIIDRRNPEPYERVVTRELKEPSIEINCEEWKLPSIDMSLLNGIELNLPTFELHGYEYNNGLQPYHIEIWIEKSTMDDILKPLCDQYGINLVIGVGYLSITSINKLLDRAESINKPCRIFYISDFDPAGVNMPLAVSRQIEFWFSKRQLKNSRIQLEHLALTNEQVAHYKLPRVPIKDSDKRGPGFEEKHGTGAVELDAIEALHPGELNKIVENSILKYYDVELENEVKKKEEDSKQVVENLLKDKISPYRKEIDNIKDFINAIVEHYEEQLLAISNQMGSELAPFVEKLNMLRQSLIYSANEIKNEYDLPTLTHNEVEMKNDGCLFDMRRSYMQQLAFYKKYKKTK